MFFFMIVIVEKVLFYKIYFYLISQEWVVFVYGVGGSLFIWFKQIKVYWQYFNLLLIDLCGYGKFNQLFRDWIVNCYMFKIVMLDVLKVFDYLKIQLVYFVGMLLGIIIVCNFVEFVMYWVNFMVFGGVVI